MTEEKQKYEQNVDRTLQILMLLAATGLGAVSMGLVMLGSRDNSLNRKYSPNVKLVRQGTIERIDGRDYLLMRDSDGLPTLVPYETKENK